MQHPKETYRCLHFRLDQFSFFHLSASHWMLSINKVTLHGNQLTLLSSYGVLSQLYADDTQAYLHCPSTSAMGAARTMHQAMGALADWMSSNRLRLNAQKTKFIWLGNRQQLAK